MLRRSPPRVGAHCLRAVESAAGHALMVLGLKHTGTQTSAVIINSQ